jgi:hypothetical protein
MGGSIIFGLVEYVVVCARVASVASAAVDKRACEFVLSSNRVATISSCLKRRMDAKRVNGLSSVTSGAMNIVTSLIS